jgi:hypothetical protein
MKKHLLTVALLLLAAVPAAGQVSFGRTEKIDTGWQFMLLPDGAVTEVGIPEFGRTARTVDLPHDWSVEGVLSPDAASATGYLPGGVGWYRKTVDIPAKCAGQKVYLCFEGVYNRSTVWVNGQEVGYRPNGYVSFLYDITPYVMAGKPAEIAVRVDHSLSADSRWYTGSGIYRDVWLVYADPVHIAPWGVYAYPATATEREGVLHVETELENGSATPVALTVDSELFAADGRSVARQFRQVTVAAGRNETVIDELKVTDPLLWSVDTPNLYTLKTVVSKDGRPIDETTTVTGFRTFVFDPDRGFALNGEAMKVRGVCIHHDAGVLGSAVPREVWRRRLIALKGLGVNAIRTSHNPQAPDLYELCDELGLLVLNEAYDEWEFPKRKWLEGWNVGVPGFQGSSDFFGEWGETDLADFVRRDRNHPSVFAWSIGNEVDYPNDPYSHPVLDGDGSFTQPIFGGYRPDAPDAMRLGAIAGRLAAVVRRYDPSRPVTAGLAGVAMSNETEYPGTLDIAGYNYTESKYDEDHARYPQRVLYGSENSHDYSAWKAVTDRDFIFGQFLWTGIDYLGEARAWPTRGFYSGLLDFAGFVKPRGYFRASLWSDEPMARLGTYPVPAREQRPSMDAWPVWNYAEGQMIRVVCYTNAAQARLELNGEPLGQTKPYDGETGIIAWDIPFRPGTLEVIGLDAAGSETARHAIQTSGRPVALRIVESDGAIGRDRGVAQVAVQVTDAAGIPVMLSDDLVTCTVTGPAHLLGLEAGNNTDMTDYTDNEHRVFHGRMMACIEANGLPGETVRVRFTAPWLESAEIELKIED